MLSTAERKFLSLFIRCSEDGNFSRLRDNGYDNNYQNVIWYRIKRKHNLLAKDNSLIKKALELRKVFS